MVYTISGTITTKVLPNRVRLFIHRRIVGIALKKLNADVSISSMCRILDELKLARVVPIFKSGDSSNINNYRPISILSFFFQNI